MARPGSDKQSLVGTVLTPALGCALSGAQEPDREGRLCCLGVDALGDHAALGGVSRAGQPATVSGAGFVPSKPHHQCHWNYGPDPLTGAGTIKNQLRS